MKIIVLTFTIIAAVAAVTLGSLNLLTVPAAAVLAACTTILNLQLFLAQRPVPASTSSSDEQARQEIKKMRERVNSLAVQVGMNTDE